MFTQEALDRAILKKAMTEGDWVKIDGWPSLGAFDLAERGFGEIRNDNKPTSIDFKISERGMQRQRAALGATAG